MSDGNHIWEKAELRMVAVIETLGSAALLEANVYAGHLNAPKKVPHIVCDVIEGEPLTTGLMTGNWLLRAIIIITGKQTSETGQDHSRRFGAVYDLITQSDFADQLSSLSENFTCFIRQVKKFTKRIIGTELVSEIELELQCCGSSITS